MEGSKTHLWDKNRGVIRSSKGGWVIGKGVFTHGHSLMELVRRKSYFEVLILNVTGRLPEPRLAKWLEATYCCMSFPDPRIWCNQIGALGGTCRTAPFSGILAGIMASDSRMYGPGTEVPVHHFLMQAMAERRSGLSIEEIVTKRARRPGSQPTVPGFGRPIATGDERVMALEQVTQDLGFVRGEYLTLAYEIEEYLLTKYKESMNLASYLVAFLADQNWSLSEMRQLTTAIVMAGVTACYDDANKSPPESFLPLHCDDIEYKGAAPRPVPEKD